MLFRSFDQVDAAKGLTDLVANTVVELLHIGVELHAHTSRCQALLGANRHNTGLAIDERQLVDLAEVVHLGHQQFAKPRRDDPLAVARAAQW